MFSSFNTSERLRNTFFTLVSLAAGLYVFGLVWHELQALGYIILIFFFAWLIAFVLGPSVAWLEKRGVVRGLAVTIVYLAVLLLVIGFGALLLPIINSEIRQIAGRIAYLADPVHSQGLNDQMVAVLNTFGVATPDARHLLAQAGQTLQGSFQSLGASLGANIVGIVSSVSSLLLYSFITLIISFYMVVDGAHVAGKVVAKLPPPWQHDVQAFEGHLSRVFGGYIRSQLLIGLSYGLLTWLVLVILGVPSGLIVALIAGLILLFPFVGPFLSLIPPAALVLLEVPFTSLVRSEAILLIALFVAQQVVMQGLAPRIMSYGVGVHPLWLFAALFVGAAVGGLWVAFFAAPIAALISVVVNALYDRWARTSTLFPPAQEPPREATVAMAAAAHEHNGVLPTPVAAETIPEE